MKQDLSVDINNIDVVTLEFDLILKKHFKPANKFCTVRSRTLMFNVIISSDKTFLWILTFLAHLSWKLKWAFLIACRPSSVCPSVCLSVNFSHFHLLLQNHWANFNQTWHKASLGEGDSKEGSRPFQRGDNNEIAKKQTQN